MRRRPPSRRPGAAACLLVLLLAAAGCSDTVTVDSPKVSRSQARACSALVRHLPTRVADQQGRDVDSGDGYAAAWGDPAIELRCGVPHPDGFDRFSTCQRVNGVDWFVPESQQTGKPTDITMTTVGRVPRVEVSVPEEYWPPANAMADLAKSVKAHLREVKPCV